MRFAAYAGTSMVLASGVLVRALHQRANFYSVCVYLAQSNACLMILTNLALLGLCTAMLGLQRLFYGALRPIEIEQLYEKAWFAITETCLAMTIFRDEVGGWFLVMFVCLLIGKVWGWIGEGRVEILEQQPPADPRLFHARLSFSLVISSLFNMFLLRYSVRTVLLQARPNMMVMFAFEFAVLTVTSLSTTARYMITLHESAVIKNQINSRRSQILQDREQNQRVASESDQATPSSTTAENEIEIDAIDIDVPGWEEKGRWVFYLDLATDFFKLILYLTFFCVLCMFYGMPIHIIRDVAMTIRSFYKRINDFIRYRQATRDMNARYPDATPEEISREDVCIICRENMNPWRPPGEETAQHPEAAVNNLHFPLPMDERLRPKKLPCGHILHFACLRSWLERQQNCPTCRAPVLGAVGAVSTTNPVPVIQQGRAHPQIQQPQGQIQVHEEVQRPIVRQNVFNFGPFRLAFGRQGLAQPVNNTHPPNQLGPAPAAIDFQGVNNAVGVFRQALATNQRTIASFTTTNIQLQLYQLEQQLMRDINDLRVQADQLFLVRALQDELTRLRMVQENPVSINTLHPATNQDQVLQHGTHAFSITQILGIIQEQQQQQQQQRQEPGSQSLPDGMVIPDGWRILPLQRISGTAGPNSNPSTFPQSPDINIRRAFDHLLSQSISPALANPHGAYQLNDSVDRTTGPSNILPGPAVISTQETSSTPLRPGPNVNTAIVQDWGGDAAAQARSAVPRSSQVHRDDVQGAVPAAPETVQIPASPPAIPRWASGPATVGQDRESNIVENTTPQSSMDAHLPSISTNKDTEMPAESSHSKGKGKGKAATVEDFIEEMD